MSRQDFFEFMETFHRKKVKGVIIGGYAMAFHGFARQTDDVDILIDRTEANVARARDVVTEFMGVPPPRIFRPPGGFVRLGGRDTHIDLTMKIDGIDAFAPVWKRSLPGQFLGIPARFMGAGDVLRTKRASGRPKDQLDILFLSQLLGRPPAR